MGGSDAFFGLEAGPVPAGHHSAAGRIDHEIPSAAVPQDFDFKSLEVGVQIELPRPSPRKPTIVFE